MSFLSKAFHHIGHAISHGLHDLSHLAKSVVTLDLKGIENSAKDLVHDAGELARGGLSLTPAGLAAKALLKGNYEKLMDKVESFAEGMATGVIDDADQFAKGLGKTVNGIAHGDMGAIGKGLLGVGLGGAALALDFCPATAGETRVARGLVKEGVKDAEKVGARKLEHETQTRSVDHIDVRDSHEQALKERRDRSREATEQTIDQINSQQQQHQPGPGTQAPPDFLTPPFSPLILSSYIGDDDDDEDAAERNATQSMLVPVGAPPNNWQGGSAAPTPPTLPPHAGVAK